MEKKNKKTPIRKYKRKWIKGFFRIVWIKHGDKHTHIRKWVKGHWRRIPLELEDGAS